MQEKSHQAWLGEILAEVHDEIPARISGGFPRWIPRGLLEEIPKAITGRIFEEIHWGDLAESHSLRISQKIAPTFSLETLLGILLGLLRKFLLRFFQDFLLGFLKEAPPDITALIPWEISPKNLLGITFCIPVVTNGIPTGNPVRILLGIIALISQRTSSRSISNYYTIKVLQDFLEDSLHAFFQKYIKDSIRNI